MEREGDCWKGEESLRGWLPVGLPKCVSEDLDPGAFKQFKCCFVFLNEAHTKVWEGLVPPEDFGSNPSLFLSSCCAWSVLNP